MGNSVKIVVGLRETNPKLSVLSVRKKDTRPMYVEAVGNL